MKPKIFICDLEPIESRYTVEWKTGIPRDLEDYIKSQKLNYDVVIVEGDEREEETTPGAFLNFASTNVYKAEQAIVFSELIASGELTHGDRILFTDAWNPVILQVKYMIDLLELDVKLFGIWHAGSYDPNDFLGRKIKDDRWAKNTERALYHALDVNFVATEYHSQLLYGGLFTNEGQFTEKNPVIVGQPHDTLVEIIRHTPRVKKDNLVVFPHRLAPEKQLDLFLELAEELPQYEFFVCQQHKLSKKEYHDVLNRSKLVFSASLQETLGIAVAEGMFFGANVMVPDHLSYSEMYDYNFKYNPAWITDREQFELHKGDLKEMIIRLVDGHRETAPSRNENAVKLEERFFTGYFMFEQLTA